MLAAEEKPAAKIDFNRDIKPILAKNCYACHGADDKKRSAALRLDERDAAVTPRKKHPAAIVPGKADKSSLIERIESDDDAERMPPPETGSKLTKEQTELLKRWINQGAEYQKHWSFVAPGKPIIPIVRNTWAKQHLDHYILAELERQQLTPSPEADKYALLRRVSLDLRGLPPTLAEVEAFEKHTSANAYEKMVDKFLADPAYGERWARVWLDLARYADSAGYGSDPLRLNMWRYRDWVIEAFNKNMPYDQFTIEQLAGDLLANPTLDQKIATAFHRNTMTNTEGGTDREEFRVAAVKDRINTTMQVWMGLTMGCAQCHSHKYDPISHHEYYQGFAIFNQTADNDQPNETPTMPAPTLAQTEKNKKIDGNIVRIRQWMEIPTIQFLYAQAAWEKQLVSTGSWQTLKPVTMSSQAGLSFDVDENGVVEVVAKERPKQDSYTLATSGFKKPITGLQLESLPLPSSKGAGLADDGNFVISKLNVFKRKQGAKPPSAYFVRIELPGKQRILSLAEVEVFEGTTNIARTGDTSQSSEDFRGQAARAIDGNTDGDFFKAQTVTHTLTEENPWWEVKLSREATVDRIVLWNRTGGVEKRLDGAIIQLLDVNHMPIWEQKLTELPNPMSEVETTGERIPIKQALADHSQTSFSVNALVQNMSPTKTGWAVGPHMQQPHQATLIFQQPIDVKADEELVIKLDQKFHQPHYLLGRFRLSASDDTKLAERAGLPAATLAILNKKHTVRSKEDTAALANYYRSIAPGYNAEREAIALQEKSRPTIAQLPVMAELPADKHRKTRVMVKGNFLDPSDAVEANTLKLFPVSISSKPNRLDLARWLIHPDNPLTARVAVNRLWSQVFGGGLVESEEDFGTQGDIPSHPELLDYLAWHFQHELKWDTKAFLKELVTSATYRQSSKVTTEMLQKDPRNRWLSRGPRFRLEAEMVRDQALAIAGLLSRKVGGPSVFPKQPDGLWQAAFNGERTWMTSRGDEKYRRGLYTFWRRTIPYPSMAAFDAPSRELCQIKRIRSNTPVQAFVTLNDPVYIEAAQALARRLVKEGGSSVEDRLRFGLKLTLSRPADDRQVQTLKKLFEEELKRQSQSKDSAKRLATEPLGPLPDKVAEEEIAAWTVVANVLLNLDAIMNK